MWIEPEIREAVVEAESYKSPLFSEELYYDKQQEDFYPKNYVNKSLNG